MRPQAGVLIRIDGQRLAEHALPFGARFSRLQHPRGIADIGRRVEAVGQFDRAFEMLAGPLWRPAHFGGQRLEDDERPMNGAAVIVLVKLQRPCQERPHGRQVANQIRGQCVRNRQPPRGPEQKQHLDILDAGHRQCRHRILTQPLGNPLVSQLETAQAVVAGADIVARRAVAERQRPLVVIPLGQIGVDLQKGVGIQGEPAARGHQRLVLLRLGVDDRLERLEQERQRIPHQFGILFGKIDIRIRECGDDRVDRHRPQRAGAGGRHRHNEQHPAERRPDLVTHA